MYDDVRRSPEDNLTVGIILCAQKDKSIVQYWKDGDKIRNVISEDIPKKVSLDKAYQNAMKNSDKQNARIEHDSALRRVILELLYDHNELYKQFSDNPAFKKWLSEANFDATYTPPREFPEGVEN